MRRTSGARKIAIAAVMMLVWLGTGGALFTAEGKAPAAPDKPIDINRASAEELTAIPGIGSSLAQRIVEFREEHGPFKRVEDLLKIRGIGEKSLEKIRPHIKVSAKS